MIISPISFTYPDAIPRGLQVAAKRYTEPHSSADGLTLIMAHGAGCNKEFWEPVIENLLKLEHRGAPTLREAWSLDWQSHGEAAVLNLDVLLGDTHGPSVEEWGKAIRHFVLSKTFAGHRLVAIGHCMGASALMFSAAEGSPYEAFVSVESLWVTPKVFHQMAGVYDTIIDRRYASVVGRRDTWSSREEAYDFFANTMPWKVWDKRVLERYVNHGLRDASGPDAVRSHVTLACHKLHEGAATINREPHLVAFNYCQDLDPQFPFHVIYGEQHDLVPQFAHDSVLESRSYSSVSRIAHTGHSIVQENPDGLSVCLGKILSDAIRGASLSKL